MKTKDLLKIWAIALVCPLFITSCDSDNDDEPTTVTPASTGLYIINSGNQSSGIDGSISYLDYGTSAMSQKIFTSANGRGLGTTANSAIIYGSKMYIMVTNSNTIEIVDKKTCKSIKQIQPTTDQGSMPRNAAAYEGKVYVSMFDGNVSRIDTTSLAIDATIKVGPNPEEVTIANDYLYVANSDGNNWNGSYADGKSVSKIKLSTFTEEKKITVGLNPTKLCSDTNGNIFILAMGDYGTTAAKIQKIDRNDNVTDFANGTLMAIKDNILYVINAPYGAESNTYISYNSTTGTTLNNNFVTTQVDSPCAINVDPVTGKIYISSYELVSGYASYKTDGYVNEYSSTGDLINKYTTGVGPIGLTFVTNLQ